MIDLSKVRLLAVVPEHHSGPGWSNSTMTIYYAPIGGGPVEFDYLQPDEWAGIVPRELFEIGAVCAAELARCVRSKVGGS